MHLAEARAAGRCESARGGCRLERIEVRRMHGMTGARPRLGCGVLLFVSPNGLDRGDMVSGDGARERVESVLLCGEKLLVCHEKVTDLIYGWLNPNVIPRSAATRDLHFVGSSADPSLRSG